MSPSQKSTLFNLVQNIMTNGERLFRTRLKERPVFTCSTFSRTSSGLQKLLDHLTGKPFKMENLAILHIELVDPSLQRPLTFFLAEVIKNLSAQRKAKKREDLNLLKANILAKISFLDHILNLAYASTTIDTWLKTFFDTPALAPTAPKGPPPPPSTNMATGTGGRHTGVIGKVQTHLITTYFHALPRKQPPVCQPASQPACLATSEPKVQLQAPPPSQ